jgi:hypothetical protein
MIKKFKTFIDSLINESVDTKTEYQILHLNRDERIDYFTQRLENFRKNGNSSFEDYEIELCPVKIRKEYIDLCVETGEGLSDNIINELDENKKIIYILNSNLESYGLPDDMFKNLSEELKSYYINKKIETTLDEYFSSYHAQLTEEEFDWCSEELKLKYMENRLTDNNGEQVDYITDNEFKWCSDELKIKYINKMFESSTAIDSDKFKLCSEELKKYCIVKTLGELDYFQDYLFDLCSDDLKKYFIKSTKNTDFYLSDKQKEYNTKHNL